MEVPINYLVILLCGVVACVLGMVWYGPLFGKAWMKSIGLDMDTVSAEEKKKGEKAMPKNILITFVGALISAYVLAHGIAFGNAYLAMSGIEGGLQGAFWYWLGLTAVPLLAPVLWEGRPWKYWFIGAGYYLVSFSLMATILALWS